MSDNSDGRLECGADGLLIHAYYFPTHSLGTKRIAYNSIRGVKRFDVPGPSKWRIWGTTLLNRWANYDPQRPNKKIGFFVDIGKRVKPFITPDDPDASEAVIKERASLGLSTGAASKGAIT
jgi:hypothetical protein